MPLSFIKKLADKLLGTSKPANKMPAKKTEQTKKGAPPAHAQAAEGRREGDARGGRGRGPGGRPARDGQRGDEAGGRPPRRGPAHEGGARPGRGEPRGGSSAPQHGGSSAPQHGGRPVARPPAKERYGRGGERGERPVSDPHTRRPGGVVADEVMAKRRDEHAAWSLDQYAVEPAEGKKRFHDFDLPSELMHAVSDMGFQYCTPIQAMSLEHALAGKNVAGKAQTGTGKTAAFLVAILTRYLRTPESRQEKGGAPRALVIAPTRELVIQICKDADAIGKYCGLRSLAVYGGMDYERQKREVSDAPVDLLVATPGRLLDFVRSRVIDLSKVDTLVIDEADRMLDMGFIPDVRSIINRLPPKEKRSTMLYSATLNDDVMRLASQWMEAPVRVEVESEQVTTKTVKQIVYVVTANEKFTVLYNQIQQYPDSRMLIFCNRRNTTEDVAESLSRRGIRCEMLSGDVNQNRRLRVLEDFREGKVRIVVATDVAGRGLHVDDIGFVINFDFPYEPEDYVHRIGRTGRAGASGTAISFADEDESFIIPDIEKYIGEELKCTVLRGDEPLLAKLPEVRRSHAHRERGGPGEERPRGNAAPQPAAAPAPAPHREPAAAEPAAQPEEKPEPRAPAPAPERPAADRPAETAKREEPQPRPAPAAPARPVQENRPREARPAPAPLPGHPGRTPRFSEDWVPGQSGK